MGAAAGSACASCCPVVPAVAPWPGSAEVSASADWSPAGASVTLESGSESVESVPPPNSLPGFSVPVASADPVSPSASSASDSPDVDSSTRARAPPSSSTASASAAVGTELAAMHVASATLATRRGSSFLLRI